MAGVRTNAGAPFGLHRGFGSVAAVLPMVAQTLSVVLGKDEQHERVDAAVGVAQADTDVISVHEGGRGVLYAQINDLNHVIWRPAQQEECDDHQDHLGGTLGPQRLFTLDPAHRAEHMVEGQGVEGADDEKGHQEAHYGLVQRVPVHVLRAIQVYHAHTHVLLGDDFGVDHHRYGEQ